MLSLEQRLVNVREEIKKLQKTEEHILEKIKNEKANDYYFSVKKIHPPNGYECEEFYFDIIVSGMYDSKGYDSVSFVDYDVEEFKRFEYFRKMLNLFVKENKVYICGKDIYNKKYDGINLEQYTRKCSAFIIKKLMKE